MVKKQKKSGSTEKNSSRNKKPNYQTIQVSKIDESYNTDKPDNLNGREEFNEYKSEKKGHLQDLPIEHSSELNSKRVK